MYIARRYLLSKSSQNAVNIINFITFLVIVIGSAALFIVLSGFAGLKTFSLSFSNTFDPDLKATALTGKFFSVSPDQERKLSELKNVASYSKELEERVSLSHRQLNHIAMIKGVDTNYTRTTHVDSTLYFGEWYIEQGQGVAGIEIVNLLGLTINQYRDPLVVLAPKPGTGFLSQQSKPYNELPLVISGVYQIEENLDQKYIFTDLKLVRALLEKDSTEVSGINFKLAGNAPISDIKKEVSAILGNEVVLRDRQEQNVSLHRMLQTENLATYLIFTLVLVIALFNLVGAIIMMVLDKRQNLKTLYDFGATFKELRRIFFVQGVLVSCLGGFIGVALGSLLVGSQLAFGWLKITPSLAYPVEYLLINVVIVLGTIFVLGALAAMIASSRVTKKLIAP